MLSSSPFSLLQVLQVCEGEQPVKRWTSLLVSPPPSGETLTAVDLTQRKACVVATVTTRTGVAQAPPRGGAWGRQVVSDTLFGKNLLSDQQKQVTEKESVILARGRLLTLCNFLRGGMKTACVSASSRCCGECRSWAMLPEVARMCPLVCAFRL